MKEGWKYKKLKDVATYYNGLTYKPTDVTDDGVLVLRSSNIQDNKLSLLDQVRVSKKLDEKLKVHKGDIIMCSRNGSKTLIGKVAIVPEEIKDLTFGTFMMIFKSEYNPFLYYFFLSDVFKKQIWKGEATMINQITRYMLDEVSVPVPTLPEQQQIVEYLDAQFKRIDALKANAENQLQAAKDLFQAALKELLTPKEGWVEKKLGEMYDVRDGTHDSPKYFEHGFPLVTSKNLKGGYIDIENVKRISKQDYDKINERSKVDVGDVLFAMIGTIGNATLVEEEPEYAIKNMALFKVPNNQSSKFLKYLLDSKSVLDEMHKKAKGTTQTFVSLGFLRNFTIYAPTNKSEQEELVERIDNLSNKIKALQSNYEQTTTLCNDLKQSLLKKVFE